MSSIDDPRARFRYLTRGDDSKQNITVVAASEQTEMDGEGRRTRHNELGDSPKVWRSVGLAVARRLLVGFLTIVVIIFLTYLGLRMAKGVDFQVAARRALEQTPRYLQMLAHGNLGMTVEYGFSRRPVPVSEVLPRIFLMSFGLLSSALLIATVSGVSIGMLSALRRGRTWSLPVRLISILGISAPSFFTALALQLLVIRITQSTGRTFLPVGGFGWDEHLILPALVLAARPFAQITRVSFMTFTEINQRDFIRTARSKGLYAWWINTRHVWPNALIPILTTLAVAMRFSLISLPIVEFFFGWQGVGFYLLKAISTQEFSFAIAMLLCLSLTFILLNAIIEVCYRLIDPRLRQASDQGPPIEAGGFLDLLRGFPRSIMRGISGAPLLGRLVPRTADEILPSLEVGSGEIDERLVSAPSDDRPKSRAWIQGTLRNPALLIGVLLVLGLGIITVFGVQLAPESPYTTRGLTITDGEFLVPPFPPDESHPLGTDLLGRDMLSLILAGAQQTFVLVAVVVIGRILLGSFSGAIAGWLNGGWIDRILMGVVEVLAGFPALLLAMVLILALDIHRGMPPFFIALTFVGWGEIMQFVRAEVMRLKSLAFIESAIASGASVMRLLGRHIQPNLLPALVSLTVLEMGAVLMILGELGFVGVFIGGGIFAELEWMAPLFHYSDVPEWGALLGNLRTYARGYPWMAIYPSVAFFLAILAFNLFGEGLHELIECVGARATRWINRYSMAAIVMGVFALVSIKGATGELASYRRQASRFDGANVIKTIELLAIPSVEGRALGTIGMDVTAAWIAEAFADLDLQPAGEDLTYFQTRMRAYEQLSRDPTLVFDLPLPEISFQEDFNVYPSAHAITGVAYAPVTFLALGEVHEYERLGYRYYDLEDLEYSDEILLVFPEDMFYVDQIHRKGTLVIARDASVLQRHFTLSPYGMWGRGAPSLWVSESLAARLLQAKGLTLQDLDVVYQDLGEEQHYAEELGVQAAMQVEGEPVEDHPVQHVIGHWQGTVSNEFEGIDDELFIVLAQYDCPPPGPDGEALACSGDNASGVGVMLEAVRAMRAAGYQPYRTFLFIAYSGEGFEGGGRFILDNVDRFLEAKYGFSTAYDLKGVIELRGLGGGSSERLQVTSDGSLRLTTLFERAAGDQNLQVDRIGEDLDLERIFEDGSTIESGAEVPWITISREGWGRISRTGKDQPGAADSEYLERVGRALTQMLMVLGRELDY